MGFLWLWIIHIESIWIIPYISGDMVHMCRRLRLLFLGYDWVIPISPRIRSLDSLPAVFVSTPYFAWSPNSFHEKKKNSIAFGVSIAILIMTTLTPMKGVMTILEYWLSHPISDYIYIYMHIYIYAYIYIYTHHVIYHIESPAVFRRKTSI